MQSDPSPSQTTISLELSDLVAKSKALRTALRDKDSDLSTVLSELYSEKAHFLYELLQNAEDAGATSMEIVLLPAELIVRHNGRVFNVQDIKAITGISNTGNAKKKDQDKIGRFGIGFKSVFKIATRPRIQSGDFDFEIEDYIVPVLAAVSSRPSPHTIITLPFTGNEQEQADTYRALATELQTLDTFNLLFLRKLETLELRWDVHTRKLHRQSQRHAGQDFDTHVILIDEGTATVNSQQYLLFQAPVRHPDFQKLTTSQYVALAFQVGADAQGATQLMPARSGFAFVFFATRYPTHLKFLVHAPFVTTPSREFLKMDARVNDALVEELGDLQRLVLPYLKKHKLLTVQTLCLLPLVNPEKIAECPPLYRKLFTVLREELTSEQAWLPILHQQYHQPAAKLLLAGSKELVTLLPAREQLNALWPGHTHWLPITITAEAVATRDLHAYLKQEIGIREIDPVDAVKLCTPAFLARQKAVWMQQFYGFLAKSRPAWWQSKGLNSSRTAGFLRTQPIMRLPGNRYLSPFDEADRPQVFLPLDDDDLPLDTNSNCIEPAAIDSKPARRFLGQLGLKKPDLLDEVRLRILPLYREGKGPSYKQHLRHCRLLVKVFGQGGEKQRELLALLHDPQLRFVRPRGESASSGRFCSYTEAYLPSPELEAYFWYTPRVRFVDEKWYEDQGVKGWRTLLQASGFKHDEPWIRKFDPRFSEKYLLQLRKQQHTHHPTNTSSYKLEGLTELLQSGKLTPELSWLAWRMLIRACKDMQGGNEQSALLGKHEWFYNKWHCTYFPSQLRQLLESEKWLWVPAENGVAEWRTVLDTELAQLPDAYEQESDGARFLVHKLAWKSDARAQLEQSMSAEELARWRAFNQAVSEGLDIEAALRAQRATQKPQRELDQRRLDEAPPLNAASFVERPFEPAKHTPVADIGTRSNSTNNAPGTTGSVEPGSAPAPSKFLLDGIGQRGELVVWQVLQQQYDARAELACVERTSSVVRYWHAGEQEHYVLEFGNTGAQTSVGHDLLVRRGTESIRYIEVKATASSGKDEFQISARQWAVATELWKQGRGKQFELWVVREALSKAPSYTMIDDPVGRWRRGEFGATPVVIIV